MNPQVKQVRPIENYQIEVIFENGEQRLFDIKPYLQRGGWWIGWVEEILGVNCQERTRGDLLNSLKVTLREALEFIDR